MSHKNVMMVVNFDDIPKKNANIIDTRWVLAIKKDDTKKKKKERKKKKKARLVAKVKFLFQYIHLQHNLIV